jgi:capsular exopolysaccharide synthesis family protein
MTVGTLVDPFAQGAQPEQAAAEPISLRDYWEILHSRRWAFLTTFVTLNAVSIILTLSQTPIYRATSLLLIEARKPNVANTNVQEAYDLTLGYGAQDFYNTQFEVLKSRRILDPVATILGERYPELKRDPAFRLAVQVDPVPMSRLVRISVESPNPGLAADGANGVVDQYREDLAQRTSGVSDRGLQTLREMERELRPRYEAAARAEREFRESSHLSNIEESQSFLTEQLKVLYEELSRAQVLRTKSQAELTAAEGIAATTSLVLPAVSNGNESVAGTLALEVSKAELERARLAGRVKPIHPRLVELDNRIACLKQQLAAAQKSYVGQLRANGESIEALRKGLANEIEETDRKLRELDSKMVQIQFLRRESEALENEYKTVTQRIGEVSLAIAAGAKESTALVIDRALEPKEPIRPDKKQSLLLGVLTGLFGGIVTCFALERLNNTFQQMEDVERILRYPLLGVVPSLSGHAKNGTSGQPHPVELTAVDRPQGSLAESFRTIRTALSFTLPARSRHAVVVTSAVPAEGKTFSSVNLAYSLAQAGKRVLLVDADLRRARIHEIFGLGEVETGLSALLSGSEPVTAIPVQAAGFPNLDLLPSGPLPSNPSELLQSERLRAILDVALACYDWVILDAPPILTVADASIVAAQTHHAILVVRSLVTEKRAALRAKELLSRTPGAVAGVILNDAREGHHSSRHRSGYSYRYGYGYGYGYSQPEAGGVTGEVPSNSERYR